jgi:hypothetical protein
MERFYDARMGFYDDLDKAADRATEGAIASPRWYGKCLRAIGVAVRFVGIVLFALALLYCAVGMVSSVISPFVSGADSSEGYVECDRQGCYAER